jgi:LTXXQ motif family protein
MISPTSKRRARRRLCVLFGVCSLAFISLPRIAVAQGLVKGVEQGAREGNRAAGPVGGVLGGAIGGVVGVVTGVTGVITGQQPPAAQEPNGGAKASKSATSKGAKAGKQVAVLTQNGAPRLTAEQIVANSDANIERIKKELNLTPDQEKQWPQFSSAMHYLGNNGAERLKLRIARTQRDPPDDIVEQMRNEAQFLVDRAADQRSVADAAESLYASLDDKQKQVFIEEMVRLSHERGFD